ncbi:acyl carrier protein [Polynucleobacter sp. SHI8]|uniref:acyl carrier protein n=1 Tax=unclassified Polynucleobacter TaxID=2640945 RepID=UPI0024925017|nr:MULTISPECIES: acyl carrier protein [unclassified Polynucleobacter]BDW10196.1 acyl carrier protein [Polynucleobacter sp. SHI2]BDW12642.1 acyl carrier protein [Polynucleobacter sp. SHI8]
MKNKKKLIEAFSAALGLPESKITEDLAYNALPEWDSIAHMSLVSELEKVYDIMLDTDDILGMSSFAEAKKIIQKYGVEFE